MFERAQHRNKLQQRGEEPGLHLKVSAAVIPSKNASNDKYQAEINNNEIVKVHSKRRNISYILLRNFGDKTIKLTQTSRNHRL